MMPMTSAMMRNHVEASSKYHCPSGSPVRNADQPSDTCSSVVTVPVTSPSNESSPPTSSSDHVAEMSSPLTVSVTSSVAAPASKTSMPKLSQGMKPMIMTTKVRPNTTRDHFWRAVMSFSCGCSSASTASCCASPYSARMTSCSCKDRMVEPLSALTFLA